MTVEVFEKGSNFKNFVDIFWRVVRIEKNGGEYILVAENPPNDVLDAEKCELRVSY